MKLTRVGVDLAKQVFQVHGVDGAERPVWCQRLKRGRWIAELERNPEPGCQIGMEACGGAHHWAALLESGGEYQCTNSCARNPDPPTHRRSYRLRSRHSDSASECADPTTGFLARVSSA